MFFSSLTTTYSTVLYSLYPTSTAICFTTTLLPGRVPTKCKVAGDHDQYMLFPESDVSRFSPPNKPSTFKFIHKRGNSAVDCAMGVNRQTYGAELYHLLSSTCIRICDMHCPMLWRMLPCSPGRVRCRKSFHPSSARIFSHSPQRTSHLQYGCMQLATRHHSTSQP